MRKEILSFALVILSLFLMISAVGAEEIISENANAGDTVVGEEAQEDNSELITGDSDACNGSSSDSSDGVGDSNDCSADGSIANSTNSSGNQTENKTVDNVPSKFSSAKNVASTYGKKAKFSLKVLNNEGKAINHTLVTFKVSSKTYKAYTNANGIASIYLNLNAGKYTIRYYSGNLSGKNSYSVRNYYKITLFKWKSGANVLKNKRIKANVPSSALVKRVVGLAKSGTPVVMFRGGKGKTVFITAGCHGNELPPQIAAMKLIKYLESHPIKGTVYVMPFMNPKGTAANVRDYNGIHLNKKANKKGTISYKTVQLIKKYKCDAYGDFHSSRPGGKPGKNLAFGSYRPTKKSASIAKYIAKNAKVKYKIYRRAGSEYPGALEDEVNIKGIPAVTCEVLSPHGHIKKGSAGKSLLMMKTLLRYNKNYKYI